MKNNFCLKILLPTIFIFAMIVSANAQTANNVANNNISEEFTFDALIYPNPVADSKFYVKSDDVIRKVEVINVIGQTVKTVNNETNVAYNIFVQFNDFEPGMYMVRITSADNKKIIKKVLIK